MAMQSTKDSSVETFAAVAQTLETWGHTDVVLHADGEGRLRTPECNGLCRGTVHPAVIKARDQSKRAFGSAVESFVANKLALEAGIGCRLLLKHPAIVWLNRHIAWLMTRYNTGHDGCSPFRKIFGKPCGGSICKFGEQVHYKLGGRPSSRVQPRWKLGAWVAEMELTDEHLLGTLAGIRSSRTICRLPKSHCFNKDALDRIVGDSDEPQARRCGQGSTGQETVHHAETGLTRNAVTSGCPRCRGRMSHSATCKKRFDAIEKKKLDKQLEEARGMRNRHLSAQLRRKWSKHRNSRRLVEPGVLLHRRRPVSRRYWFHELTAAPWRHRTPTKSNLQPRSCGTAQTTVRKEARSTTNKRKPRNVDIVQMTEK